MNSLEPYAIEVTGFFPEDPNQDSFFEEYDDFHLNKEGKIVQGHERAHKKTVRLKPSESGHEDEEFSSHKLMEDEFEKSKGGHKDKEH